MTTQTQPKHTPGPFAIIRTNKPDEPDEFAAIGPSGLRADGFTTHDGALRQALHYANYAVGESSTRLFAAQSIALKQGEALAQLIRGAEMLDDYCMGGGRPPSYDLPTIRAVLNDAANAGRKALSVSVNACEGINPEAVPELLAIVKAELDSGRNFGGDGNLYLRARDAIARATGGEGGGA